MRNLNEINNFRVTDPEKLWMFGGWAGDETCGVFLVPSPHDEKEILVIASANEDWDHISVSTADRTPTWDEMQHVKRIFFLPNETAYQLHVPAEDHVNICDTCLHIWRPHKHRIPLPPKIMV